MSDTNEFYAEDRTLQTESIESILLVHVTELTYSFLVTRSRRIVCLITIFVCE